MLPRQTESSPPTEAAKALCFVVECIPIVPVFFVLIFLHKQLIFINPPILKLVLLIILLPIGLAKWPVKSCSIPQCSSIIEIPTVTLLHPNKGLEILILPGINQMKLLLMYLAHFYSNLT